MKRWNCAAPLSRLDRIRPPESGSEEGLVESLRYIESSLGIPFTEGNKVTVLQNGDEIFPAMLEAIRQARSSILFETYVYWTGDIACAFATTLAEKAREGVTVRVMLDGFGASSMKRSLIEMMREGGAQVNWFRPLRGRFWDYDKRTHRKLLICDDAVGFTGGVGIAEEWEGDARDPSEWRDTHFRFEGPAVRGLSGTFWSNWIALDGEGLPPRFEYPNHENRPGRSLALVARSSPAMHQSDMELVFETLLNVARRSICLVTPYFNIRGKTIELIRQKARSGVQVELLIPGEHIDRRVELMVADECLASLMGENIVVRRYQRSMLHSKIIRIDESIACVGSPNFNQRSRKKDFEVAVIIVDPLVCVELDKAYREDVERSEPVDRESIRRPNAFQRLARWAIMLFREQL